VIRLGEVLHLGLDSGSQLQLSFFELLRLVLRLHRGTFEKCRNHQKRQDLKNHKITDNHRFQRRLGTTIFTLDLSFF